MAEQIACVVAEQIARVVAVQIARVVAEQIDCVVAKQIAHVVAEQIARVVAAQITRVVPVPDGSHCVGRACTIQCGGACSACNDSTSSHELVAWAINSSHVMPVPVVRVVAMLVACVRAILVSHFVVVG